jgi:hypothetical protein
MKAQVNFSTFQSAFENLRPNNFSYEGLTALYDYLEEIEESTGEEIELDVIALCCEFEELSLEEVIRQYSIDCDDIEDDDIEEHVLSHLDYHSSVVGKTDNSIVFRSF